MIVKRLFDFLVSFFFLILLMPIFLIICILIKIDSKGPIFFKQERIGKNQVPFYIYKFRSMIPNQDEKSPPISLKDDARVTKIGAFLRKFKIDELPQLFNVFKGEMSLVGPRPELKKYVDCYSYEDKLIIFRIPPGITDLGSLYFYNESIILESTQNAEEVYIQEIIPAKIKFYREYVLNRTFFLDLKIIFLTLLKCFGFTNFDVPLPKNF